jgi:hypothetical protein
LTRAVGAWDKIVIGMWLNGDSSQELKLEFVDQAGLVVHIQLKCESTYLIKEPPLPAFLIITKRPAGLSFQLKHKGHYRTIVRSRCIIAH